MAKGISPMLTLRSNGVPSPIVYPSPISTKEFWDALAAVMEIENFSFTYIHQINANTTINQVEYTAVNKKTKEKVRVCQVEYQVWDLETGQVLEQERVEDTAVSSKIGAWFAPAVQDALPTTFHKKE